MRSAGRVAAYLRVSTLHQVTNTSLASQRRACEEYASRTGVALEWFVDAGVSAGSLHRPELDRLRALCRRGLFDSVLVVALDRLSRVVGDLVELEAEFSQLHVGVVSLNEPDLGVPSVAALSRGVVGAIAQYERERLREVSARAKRHLIAEGRWPGGNDAPFGFGFARSSTGARVFVVDPVEMAVVLRIVELLVDEGLSARETAVVLNREGHRPRRSPEWNSGNLRAQVRNARWCGRWVYGPDRALGDEALSLSIPELVPAERYAAARRAVTRTQPLTAGSPSRFVYPLGGVLIGLCGRHCRGAAKQSTGRRHYECKPGFDGTRQCSCPSMNAEVLEFRVFTATTDAVRGHIDGHRTPASLRRDAARSAVFAAEVTLGRLAVALVDLPGSPETWATGLEGFTHVLQRLRALVPAEQVEPDPEPRSWVTDPVVRSMLQEGSEDERPLAERCYLVAALDLHVRIAGYDECGTCKGRGFLKGVQRRAACAQCRTTGQLPSPAVSGVWDRS